MDFTPINKEMSKLVWHICRWKFCV